MTLELKKQDITVLNALPVYCYPNNPAGSLLFQRLNMPQLYPYNPAIQWIAMGQVPGAPYRPADVAGGSPAQVPNEQEFYLLATSCGNGSQFYSRENIP